MSKSGHYWGVWLLVPSLRWSLLPVLQEILVLPKDPDFRFVLGRRILPATLNIARLYLEAPITITLRQALALLDQPLPPSLRTHARV